MILRHASVKLKDLEEQLRPLTDLCIRIHLQNLNEYMKIFR